MSTPTESQIYDITLRNIKDNIADIIDDYIKETMDELNMDNIPIEYYTNVHNKIYEKIFRK